MDGRTTVSVDDWALAAHLYGSSRALLETVGRVKRTQNWTARGAQERAQVDPGDDRPATPVYEATLERVARLIARESTTREAFTARELHHKIASRDRKVVSVQEAIEHARLKDWLVLDGRLGGPRVSEAGVMWDMWDMSHTPVSISTRVR